MDDEYATIKTSIEEEERETGGGLETAFCFILKKEKLRNSRGISSPFCVFYLAFRGPCDSQDPQSWSDSQGSHRWLRSADVPAAVRNKHGHVGLTKNPDYFTYRRDGANQNLICLFKNLVQGWDANDLSGVM